MGDITHGRYNAWEMYCRGDVPHGRRTVGKVHRRVDGLRTMCGRWGRLRGVWLWQWAWGGGYKGVGHWRSGSVS